MASRIYVEQWLNKLQPALTLESDDYVIEQVKSSITLIFSNHESFSRSVLSLPW